jgi:hypothetical protein
MLFFYQSCLWYTGKASAGGSLLRTVPIYFYRIATREDRHLLASLPLDAEKERDDM